MIERSRPFVANDLHLHGRVAGQSPSNLPSAFLLTAPNTSGKSTYLRSNACIVLLAQSGSFVPAEECLVGIVVCLFGCAGRLTLFIF